MNNRTYNAIPQEEIDMNGSKEHLVRPSAHSFVSRPRTHALVLLSTLLLSSLTANLIFIHRHFIRPWDLANDLPSKYAHLRRNIPTEILAHSEFDSDNRTVQDAAWDRPDLEPWQNFVALDEDYTIEVGLPHSQRWPWDHSKGTYILTSAHELHCVRVLRVSVNENHDGVPQPEQTWQYGHLIHCLNVLRESIMCNADDTPLYTGHLHANANSSSARAGIGTVKMCRDWNLLLQWSRERSACYVPKFEYPDIERYKYCPDGSRPWEEVGEMTSRAE